MQVSFCRIVALFAILALISSAGESQAQMMYPGAGYPGQQAGMMPAGGGYPIQQTGMYNPVDQYGCTESGNCTSAPCGCPSGCSSDCCGPSCGQKSCCGFYSGAGMHYLKPHWKTNPAYLESQTIGGVSLSEQIDFNYNAEAAPLVYAGFRDQCGLGILGRAWWFDGNDQFNLINSGTVALESASPLGLGNTSTTAGDSLFYTSSLSMKVVDLLGTYQQSYGRLCLDYGFGARYARVQQRFTHGEDPLADDMIDGVNSVHTFEGVGPSFSFEGRYALTNCFKLLAGMRYSLLYGQSNQFAESIVNSALSAQRRQANDDLLLVFEMELGAEYSKCCGHCEFFIDAAFVAQVWEGAGNSANNDIITVLVDPEVSDKNADLGLWGLRTTIGVRF